MPTRDEQFDLFVAQQARDAGLSLVEENNPAFRAEFAATIDQLPIGWVGTCEDIRRDWKGSTPTHPNAWGACWNAAKKRGLIFELSGQVHMTASKSHARKTHLYRRVTPDLELEGGEPSAIETREEPKDHLIEHPRDEEIGLPAEAGSRGRDAEGRQTETSKEVGGGMDTATREQSD
jgi:hypothetical protein